MSGAEKRALSLSVTRGTVSRGSPLTIRTVPPAGEEREIAAAAEWKKPDGFSWSERDFLVLDLTSDVRSAFTVEVRFCRGETPLFSMKNNLLGSLRVFCCFELCCLNSSRRYPRSLPGHLKCVTFGKPTHLSEVDRIEVLFWSGIGLETVRVHEVYITETLPDLTLHAEPVVDEFGQDLRRDFAGKFHSETELSDYLRAEYEKAGAALRTEDAEIDRWGGWKKLRFEARGRFYRTERDGRSWLVDPDGCAFLSNGVCYASRLGVFGMVDAFRSLFSALPEKENFAPAWTTAKNVREYVKRNGEEDAAGREMVNFARSNMIRVFGENWREAWRTLTCARMRAWGFNTVSVCVNDYKDEDFLWFVRTSHLPYCYTLRDFPRTETMLYRDFPDVFSAEYEEKCRNYAEQVREFADDPLLIGCFLTNEPEWMFQKDVSVAEVVLSSPLPSATKDAMLARLREKYGSVEALNRAWGTEFDAFRDLSRGIPAEKLRSEGAKADLIALQDLLFARFTAVPSEALRRVAPDTLNLGMRYSSVGRGAFGGTEGMDVFSFNCYRREPGEVFDLAEKTLSGPYLVGEWHIGAEESGLLSGGIVNASTQSERGKGCAQYVRSAFSRPNCVGIHYFEWNDHPLLGRFDGENKQIGLVSVCNRPYEDCIAPFAAMNRKIYRIHAGEESPAPISWAYRPRF